MERVNIHQAKTQLSQLLQGEEVVIARAGGPIARLLGWQALPSQWQRPGRCAARSSWLTTSMRRWMSSSRR